MSASPSNEGLSGEPAYPATSHAIFLDHKIRHAGGTYNSGTGLTTWVFAYKYLPTKAVHLNTGTVFTPTRVGTTYTYTATGDYSSGSTIFGREETMDIYFSRPFPRDEQGKVLLDSRLQVKHFTLHWVNSVAFDVVAYDAPYPTGGNTASYMRHQLLDPLQGDNYGVPDVGAHRHWIGRNAESMRLALFNNTVRPCTIVGVEYQVDIRKGNR